MHPSQSILKQAALFLLIGEAFLAVMGALIKSLSTELSTEQILLFRNLVGLIFLLPIMLRQGLTPLKTNVIHWHLMRGIVGVSAMYCYFWALGNMPLTEAFLVKLSSPLFMPILAALWLNEKILRPTIIALLVGFTGVAVVLKPTQLSTGLTSADSLPLTVGLIALAGAMLAALAKVTIRRMGSTESSQTIVFYFGVIATVVSLPAATLNWQAVESHLWWQIMLLGIVATLGQLALTRAYRTAPTGSVGVYAYSAVVYGALMGWFFWDEIPASTTWLGASLIIGSGFINLYKNKKATSVAH